MKGPLAPLTDELVQGVARLFGFKATSSVLRTVIEAQIDAMLEGGELEQRGNLIATPGGGRRDEAV